MRALDRSLPTTITIVAAFLISTAYLLFAISGEPNAHDVVEPKPAVSKEWLAEGSESNPCTRTPCLVVEQIAGTDGSASVVAKLMEFDSTSSWDEILRTTFTYSQIGSETRLAVRHTPTPDMMSEGDTAASDARLEANGVDVSNLRDPQILYEASGSFPFTETTIDLPYGALSQYVFDGFSKAVRAWGLEPDEEQLLTYADIVTNEVEARFDLSGIPERSRIAMILSGPTQPFTYLAALVALLLVWFETSRPSIRPLTDGVTDLIPFTGFFGTLVGVSGGLEVLGLSNVTDDVSKAMSLGKIGSSLGFAINTTILAIVVFGMVILLQYAIRSAFENRASRPKEDELQDRG